MSKRIDKKFKLKQPPPRTGIHEFPRGKKGLVFCDDCEAVYYKKSWHHSLLNLKSAKENMPVKFSLCPACKMIKDHEFEGEIIILNVPSKSREELLNFIKGFCKRAYERDPMDRLIEIKKDKNNLIITTTENQLVNKLGKKIKNLFSKAKVKTKFIKAPGDVGRVRVEFEE